MAVTALVKGSVTNVTINNQIQQNQVEIEAQKKALSAAKTDYQQLVARVNALTGTGSAPDRDGELLAMFEGRVAFMPPPPDGRGHINTFLECLISTGEGLKAESLKEAWVMAYIEKHQGDFSYNGKKIYEYGEVRKKRDAIIRLVKEKGANVLFDQIAPKK